MTLDCPVGVFFRAFIDPVIPSPVVTPNYLYNILLCIPAVIADILTGLLIYLSVRRRGATRRGFILLAAYLFNPAVIFDGAYYGLL